MVCEEADSDGFRGRKRLKKKLIVFSYIFMIYFHISIHIIKIKADMSAYLTSSSPYQTTGTICLKK